MSLILGIRLISICSPNYDNLITININYYSGFNGLVQAGKAASSVLSELRVHILRIRHTCGGVLPQSDTQRRSGGSCESAEKTEIGRLSAPMGFWRGRRLNRDWKTL